MKHLLAEGNFRVEMGIVTMQNTSSLSGYRVFIRLECVIQTIFLKNKI